METNLETQIVAIFSASDLCKWISEASLREMCQFATPLCLDAGEILIEEGSRTDQFYIVSNGNIEVQFSVSGEDSFQEVCRLHTGAVIGEMAMIEEDVHSARIVATSPAHLLMLDSRPFMIFLEQNPHIGFCVMKNLARILSRRLRYTNHSLRHLLAQ
jgi:CRP-like cAMP-binding protein